MVLLSVVCAATLGVAANILVRPWFAVPIAAVLGVVAPFAFLLNRRSARMNRFEEQFPEALDLLARALRAGHAFQTSLGMAGDEPQVQPRAILYCATEARTCFAEVFQETRRIDRGRNSPWLAVFRTERDLELLDLTGSYATRVGASMAIHSGNRMRARAWARAFYEAHADLHGLYYCSSMAGNHPAIALTDRADVAAALAEYPDFNRPLADDALLDVLKRCAFKLGYALL